jgi:hypothetical protein
LFFRKAEAGGWLVQQEKGGVKAKRAGNFDDALLAERQITGGAVQDVAKPEAPGLMGCLGEQVAFLASVESQHTRDKARATADVSAKSDIFEHGARW